MDGPQTVLDETRDRGNIKDKLKEPDERKRWKRIRYLERWAEIDRNPRAGNGNIYYFIYVLFSTYHLNLNINICFYLLHTIANNGVRPHYEILLRETHTNKKTKMVQDKVAEECHAAIEEDHQTQLTRLSQVGSNVEDLSRDDMNLLVLNVSV